MKLDGSKIIFTMGVGSAVVFAAFGLFMALR